ncbi:hypothetical protein DRV85_18655, partial [Rhodosalinus halophilus]
MHRLGIRGKIWGLAGALLGVTCVFSAIALVGIVRLADNLRHTHVLLDQAETAGQIRDDFVQAHAAAIEVLAGDSSRLQQVTTYLGKVSDSRRRITAAFLEVEEPARRKPEQAAKFNEVVDAVESYGSVLARARIGAAQEAGEILRQELIPARERIAAELDRLEGELREEARFLEAEGARLAGNAKLFVFGGAALTLFAGGVLGRLTVRRLSRGFTQVATAVARIASGDYQSSVPACERGDEIGTIARNLVDIRDKLRQAEADRAAHGAAEQRHSSLVEELSQRLSELADGDLDARIDPAAYDELESMYLKLCEDFNALAKGFTGLIGS